MSLNVKVCLQLLTNPPIIFCDEPTTGLDSFNARAVIKALKYLSRSDREMNTMDGLIDDGIGMELMTRSKQLNNIQPKAVICSIHQPTSDIFQCFSHIVLMTGGYCVFQGTTNEAFQHFSRFKFFFFNCVPVI